MYRAYLGVGPNSIVVQPARSWQKGWPLVATMTAVELAQIEFAVACINTGDSTCQLYGKLSSDCASDVVLAFNFSDKEKLVKWLGRNLKRTVYADSVWCVEQWDNKGNHAPVPGKVYMHLQTAQMEACLLSEPDAPCYARCYSAAEAEAC